MKSQGLDIGPCVMYHFCLFASTAGLPRVSQWAEVETENSSRGAASRRPRHLRCRPEGGLRQSQPGGGSSCKHVHPAQLDWSCYHCSLWCPGRYEILAGVLVASTYCVVCFGTLYSPPKQKTVGDCWTDTVSFLQYCFLFCFVILVMFPLIPTTTTTTTSV